MKFLFTALAIITLLPLASLADERVGGSRAVFTSDSELKAGEMAMRAGDLETAIEKFLAGLPTASSRRSESAALNNLCAAYGTLGKFDTALVYCDRALILRPNNWRAHTNRARSLVGKGELDAAIASANRGLAIAPNAAPLHEILALAQRLSTEPHVIIETFDANTEN